VGPPNAAVARDPDVNRAGNSVVRVLGTACGLGVEGSGWVAGPGLVVTNAHVVAGESDTTVTVRDGSERLTATAVHYEPRNDLAILRVNGLDAAPLGLVGRPKVATPGAVLGYPEDGPFHVAAARLGATQEVISQDSYGRGPIRRRMTSLRGKVRSGNSGGPVVDSAGRVLTTVFGATTSGKAGGLGVPNEIVSRALAGALAPTGTGPCAS
jgi:S1-C subfamily serine protease